MSFCVEDISSCFCLVLCLSDKSFRFYLAPASRRSCAHPHGYILKELFISLLKLVLSSLGRLSIKRLGRNYFLRPGLPMSDNFEFKHIVYFQIFLPFAINLDPYIKKVIREENQIMEDGGAVWWPSMTPGGQATPAPLTGSSKPGPPPPPSGPLTHRYDCLSYTLNIYSYQRIFVFAVTISFMKSLEM